MFYICLLTADFVKFSLVTLSFIVGCSNHTKVTIKVPVVKMITQEEKAYIMCLVV